MPAQTLVRKRARPRLFAGTVITACWASTPWRAAAAFNSAKSMVETSSTANTAPASSTMLSCWVANSRFTASNRAVSARLAAQPNSACPSLPSAKTEGMIRSSRGSPTRRAVSRPRVPPRRPAARSRPLSWRCRSQCRWTRSPRLLRRLRGVGLLRRFRGVGHRGLRRCRLRAPPGGARPEQDVVLRVDPRRLQHLQSWTLALDHGEPVGLRLRVVVAGYPGLGAPLLAQLARRVDLAAPARSRPRT